MSNTINYTPILIAVLLTHGMVSSTAEAQPGDVTGMLATVMHQLAVVTDNLAATNQKLDESISTMSELQQTVYGLADRINTLEERTVDEASCCGTQLHV